MDQIVYLDKKAEELTKILANEKTMIIRGATGRKLPYGRVNPGDILYFIENDGSGLVKAKSKVSNVLNSEKLSNEESNSLVNEYQTKLVLSDKQIKRWAGKRYLVLIEIESPETVSSFSIDKSEYGNMDDWLPVGDIEKVKL